MAAAPGRETHSRYPIDRATKGMATMERISRITLDRKETADRDREYGASSVGAREYQPKPAEAATVSFMLSGSRIPAAPANKKVPTMTENGTRRTSKPDVRSSRITSPCLPMSSPTRNRSRYKPKSITAEHHDKSLPDRKKPPDNIPRTTAATIHFVSV